MNITIALYDFYTDDVIIKKPFNVVKETDKCYFTKHGRYLKSEIGIAKLKYATKYPYVEVIMVDADEQALRIALRQWFLEKTCVVLTHNR